MRTASTNMAEKTPATTGPALSGGMGPLSMLPPWPGMLQKGGAQPRKQWQFWLLLQTPWPLHFFPQPSVSKKEVFLHCPSKQIWL